MIVFLLLLGEVSASSLKEFSIPAVTHVPTSVLQIYGLNGTYGPEPAKERPTPKEFAPIWSRLSKDFYRQIHNKNKIKLGEYTKTFLASVEDEKSRSYLEWAAAHMLNGVFLAGSLIRAPLLEASSDVFYITMGESKCPKTELLVQEFKEICNGSKVVTNEEERIAFKLFTRIADKAHFWRKLIQDLTSNNKIKAKKIPEIINNIDLGSTISPEFNATYQAYLSLIRREETYFSVEMTTTQRSEPEEFEENE